ncbi:YceI family protein [Desulfospira joergensenii]|uniref:YceI family protein n=1 Tax=Desulfospira joergensenii TaxID=53329 RepID=UPI000480E256|nr:YceI family protein [Desulfospira joergensenii]
MKTVHIFRIMTLIFFLTSAAYANEWKLDPDHSEVRFKIRHIHTTISGQFPDFQGEIFFNPEKLDKSRFDFTVKVDSVNTGNGKRDNHLRSKDFFDADSYPVMTFASSKIIRKSENIYELHGDMTIRGVTRSIQIPVLFFPPKPHPFDKKKLVAGFESGFSLARLDYNVGNGKFLKMGVVGENVDVELAMEVSREK